MILRRKAAESEIAGAWVNGRPAGYMRIERLWSKVPYVSWIVVDTSAARRGVAAALLELADGVARESGSRWLFSSSQANARSARAWHRRRGFEECGRIRAVNPDGSGEVFYRRPVSRNL
ncbi:MAG TPA: GNAT family N-acetyltransferase, partial [Planctomycetota bacterium]|nr:GNAT family N-acetyltransferase [Planctomycetota bacterium]